MKRTKAANHAGAGKRLPQAQKLEKGFRFTGALRSLTGHASTLYTLTKELAPGQYGVTWLARTDGFESGNVVVKFPKLDAMSATGLNRKSMEDLVQAIENEYEVQYALRKNRHTAQLLDYGATIIARGNGLQPVPFLVYEYIDGLPLHEWANQVYARANGLRGFSGIVEPGIWTTLATRLRAGLNHLHIERVVHGDIWPNNIMVRRTDDWATSPEPVFIDFGKSFIMDRVLDQPAMKARWQKYLAPERVITDGSPYRWYAPADIYSLGMVFFYLAAGDCDLLIFKNLTALPEPGFYEIKDGDWYGNQFLKEKILDKIKANNRTLYDTFPEVADIIMHCIRPQVDRRAADVVAVEEVMEDFCPSLRALKVSKPQALATALKVVHALGKSKALDDPIGRVVIADYIRAAQRRLLHFNGRGLTISGGRERLVGSLVRIVSLLTPGDGLKALTTSSFWKDENFGAYGRVTTALKSAARRGVSVEWITLAEVNAKGHARDKITIEDIKRAQSKLSEDIEPSKAQFLKLSLVSVRKEDVESVVRERGTFILLNTKDPRKGKATETLIVPDYTQTGGEIYALRLWMSPDTLERKLTMFNGYAARAWGPDACA